MTEKRRHRFQGRSPVSRQRRSTKLDHVECSSQFRLDSPRVKLHEPWQKSGSNPCFVINFQARQEVLCQGPPPCPFQPEEEKSPRVQESKSPQTPHEEGVNLSSQRSGRNDTNNDRIQRAEIGLQTHSGE
jgi:hypothetical protein